MTPPSYESPGSNPFGSDIIDWDFVERMRKKLVRLQCDRIAKNCPRKKRNSRFEISIIDYDQELPDHQKADISEPKKKRRRFDDDRQHPDQCHHDSKRKIFMRTESSTSASHHSTNHDNVKRDDDGKAKARVQMKEGPEPPPGMPRWLRDIVEDKGGHGWERLLIQKKLWGSDLDQNQNRISMPVCQLRTPNDFLSEDEMLAVLNRKNDDRNGFNDMNVTFVGPSQRTWVLSLRRWKYGSSSSYVFAGKALQDFIRNNGLSVDDIIQIWFFRCRNGNPYFALVNLV